MDSKAPEWANAKEACLHLGLSPTALRKLQWDGVLSPGMHWVYTNGAKNGPVRFNIQAIRKWQTERTIELFNARPETYEVI